MERKNYFQEYNGETLVSEAGAYLLALTSYKESETASEFTDWVCREVLPSLRKNGFYLLDGSKNIKVINNIRENVERLKQKPNSQDEDK